MAIGSVPGTIVGGLLPRELDRLTRSVRETGVLQPVLVQPAEGAEGEFELADGERRYRAAFKVGLTEIPALIRERESETGSLIGALTANSTARRARRLKKPRRSRGCSRRG